MLAMKSNPDHPPEHPFSMVICRRLPGSLPDFADRNPEIHCHALSIIFIQPQGPQSSRIGFDCYHHQLP